MSDVCRFHLDGEMLGSVPGKHGLVEIGCCRVVRSNSSEKFSVLIRPEGGPYEHGAYKVLRRPYQEYLDHGKDPRDAAHSFIDFLLSVSCGRKIEISCVNPGFDIGFFKVFLDQYASDEVGIIGFKSFDVTSYACAAFGQRLGSMSTSQAWRLLKQEKELIYSRYFRESGKHTALLDAVHQADLLLALEEYVLWKEREFMKRLE